MQNKAWSLIFFTLLSQFGAGLMLYITIIYFFDHQAFQLLPSGVSFLAPDFLALMVITIAVLFSFFHLGKRLNATNALNHLSSSWLSREIFTVLIFGTCVLLVFLTRKINPAVTWLLPTTLLFSAFAGILLVAMISMVYLIPTIPSWNSWHTPLGFCLSALTTGGATIVLLVHFNITIPESGFILPKSIIVVSWALAIFLAIEIIATLVFQSKLAEASPVGINQVSFNSGTYQTLHMVRIFILFISMTFLIYFIFRLPGISANFHAHVRFFAMIFALIVIEEIIGRYQFYASYYRVGV